MLGETIRRLRKAKKLTQKQVADQLGVSAPAVTQWETGGGIDMPNLRELAKVLGVPAKVLVEASEGESATQSAKSAQQGELLRDKDSTGEDNPPPVLYRTDLPRETAQMGAKVGDPVLEDILTRLRRIEGALFKADQEPANTKPDPQRRRKV